MKSIVTLLGIGLSTLVLALPPQGEFSGGGTWKQANGATGTWTEMAKFTQTKVGAHLQSKLNVLAKGAVVHSEDMEMDLIPTGNDFFDITTKDGKIGQGYCFGKVCHYDYAGGSEKGEETSVYSHRGIRKMGSSVATSPKGDEKVAWEGSLRAK